MEIAVLGHSSTQIPQSMHESASTLATSFMAMAPSGQASTQIPQAVQSSDFTTAGIFILLYYIELNHDMIRGLNSLRMGVADIVTYYDILS